MDRVHRDAPPGFGTTIPVMKPEQIVHNWQQNAVRMLRAQERVAQGVVAAARVEMRYSQELMASRLGLFKWDADDLPNAGDRAAEELEKFVSVVREMTEELRSGFTEATRLLSEATAQAAMFESPAAESPAETVEPPAEVAEVIEPIVELTESVAKTVEHAEPTQPPTEITEPTQPPTESIEPTQPPTESIEPNQPPTESTEPPVEGTEKPRREGE
jgi:cell division septum initiation protein DivIVA